MDRERDQGRHDLIERVRGLWRPAPVHYASLALGFALLLIIGRDQWFVYDDWAILHPGLRGADLLAGHQGHWDAAATLVFQLLRSTVGLHSYLPYLACAVLAHLAVVHLIWRIMLRASVPAWLATGLAGVLIVLGSAAENVLWAFQFGFMGAIAVALVAVLLVDARRLSPPRVVAVIIVSLLALPFSGTALPVLAAAGLLSIVRRGWWRSIVLFAPAGVVTLAWNISFGGGAPQSLAPHGAAVFTQVPLFLATMIGAGYGEFVGAVPLGPVIALGLLFWVFRRIRHWRGVEAPAYALLAGSVVFAILTALTRAGGELSAAGAQRYVYVVVTLAVPTMALALAWIAARSRAASIAVITAVALVGAVNVVLLEVRAGEQALIEQRVQREVSAALAVISDPAIDDGRLPIPDVAPDLTVGDLREAEHEGLISPVPYRPADKHAVLTALGG